MLNKNKTKLFKRSQLNFKISFIQTFQSQPTCSTSTWQPFARIVYAIVWCACSWVNFRDNSQGDWLLQSLMAYALTALIMYLAMVFVIKNDFFTPENIHRILCWVWHNLRSGAESGLGARQVRSQGAQESNSTEILDAPPLDFVVQSALTALTCPQSQLYLTRLRW